MDTETLIGIILMPFTYGFVGWMTNVVALKMTFYPLKFKGIKPYFGWQGIVPRKSTHLALKSVQTITAHIIKVDEFFHKIDPEKLAGELEPLLDKEIPLVLERYATKLGDWTKIDDDGKKSAIKTLVDRGNEITLSTCRQLKEDTTQVFNFKTFFVKNLTRDNSRLIVDLFQRIGTKEFKFIERSGLYFGFLLGLVQAGVWLVYPEWWTLPLQGVIVGYITNFLALTMIFRPLYEKKYGFVRYQGLFLKRQDEVSKEYSKAVSDEVLHPRKILEEVLYRRIAVAMMKTMSEVYDELIHQPHSQQAEDRAEHENEELIAEIMQCLYPAAERIEKIMARSMHIEKTMYERMRKMPPEEFEPLLRSAFKEDEYVLILIGAVLGALVGMAQSVYMLFTG